MHFVLTVCVCESENERIAKMKIFKLLPDAQNSYFQIKAADGNKFGVT